MIYAFLTIAMGREAASMPLFASSLTARHFGRLRKFTGREQRPYSAIDYSQQQVDMILLKNAYVIPRSNRDKESAFGNTNGAVQTLRPRKAG